MSFFNLDDLHNFSLSGHTLNPEERTLIRSTLLVKKQEEKLSELYFWGKIFGVNKDYYIAQGITDTADLFTRKYFYR
jgi:radial spoke head protein 9